MHTAARISLFAICARPIVADSLQHSTMLRTPSIDRQTARAPTATNVYKPARASFASSRRLLGTFWRPARHHLAIPSCAARSWPLHPADRQCAVRSHPSHLSSIHPSPRCFSQQRRAARQEAATQLSLPEAWQLLQQYTQLNARGQHHSMLDTPDKRSELRNATLVRRLVAFL